MGNKKSKNRIKPDPATELQTLMGKPEDVLQRSLKLFENGRDLYMQRNIVDAHRYYELAILYLQYVTYFSEEKYKEQLHEISCNVARHMVMTFKEIIQLLEEEKNVKIRRPLPVKQIKQDLIPNLKKQFKYKSFNEDQRMLFDSILSCICLDRKYVDWRDIIGNNAAKEALQMLAEKEINPRLIHLIKRKEIFRESGALLLGPPGCGKTVMAKAVACHVGGNVNFIDIAGDSLKGKYVGESEKLISFLFKIAKAISPCIIFIGKIIVASLLFILLLLC